MGKNRSKKGENSLSEYSSTDANRSFGKGASKGWEMLSSERYQAFVENIEVGVYEVDIHGNFQYFNNSLCRILCCSGKDILFQNFAEFIDDEYVKKTVDTFEGIYHTGQGVSDFICKIIDENSSDKVLEVSADLVTDNRGKKIGFRGIVHDVTEKYSTRKLLEKSQRRVRSLLNFVPYPLVVFTLDGMVSYLNPAFTEIFGWTFEELEGKIIPYVPPGLEEETRKNIKRLLEEKIILRYETQRLTKNGQILDVVLGASVYSETEDEPSGELVILRDITQEKRIARNNEALLRISLALPEYLELNELLDYISAEIKSLLEVEGALVILLDEENDELFFKSVAYDDTTMEKRIKEVRFPANRGICSKVVRTGEAIIVPDTSKEPDFYPLVDIHTGSKTLDLLDVPLRSKDRIIGVLSAKNKKTGAFDKTDIELLNMVAGTVALSIENARFSKEVKEAYKEVTSLNRAKGRVINHLSHELKTPISVLSASLNILGKRLLSSSLPEKTWQPTIERAQRNLERMLEMQYQVEDIMMGGQQKPHYLLATLLDKCADIMESFVAEEIGEGQAVEKIRRRIDNMFGVEEDVVSKDLLLDQIIPETIEEVGPFFSSRRVDLITRFEPAPTIHMPVEIMKKVLIGLIKNAVENTPDEGRIEVFVLNGDRGVELLVRDYGIGISFDNQRRVLDGFYSTQETIDYSSKRPFDFNAGGKGTDLLRIKIFSERYNFKINMQSLRCKWIPHDKDICIGRISRCRFCEKPEDCYSSGGTTFAVFFPLMS